MSKIKQSISIPAETYNRINEIAKRTCQGNFSKAVEWITNALTPKQFYLFMAKHHTSEMNKYRDLLRDLMEIENGDDHDD